MRDEAYYEDMRADYAMAASYDQNNHEHDYYTKLCPWCNGNGWQSAGPGDTRKYTCPDCCGSGVIEVCRICNKEVYGEYCENCYAQCEVCEEIYPADELKDGICEACKEFMAEEEEKNKKTSGERITTTNRKEREK